MEREDARLRVDVEDVEPFRAERGKSAPQVDEVPGAAVEVGHVGIAALDPVPPDHAVAAPGTVRPELVLEELLAHEEGRHARGREQQAHRHP